MQILFKSDCKEEEVIDTVRSTVRGGAEKIRKTIEELNKWGNDINTQLHSQMAQCHEQLLGNLSSVERLDCELTVVRSSVAAVQKTAARLSRDACDPFTCIEDNVRLLRRICAVEDVVRLLLRFISNISKLRQQTTSPHDAPNAAAIVSEIRQLLCTDISVDDHICNGISDVTVSIRDVQAISEGIEWVNNIDKTLRDESFNKLIHGISTMSKLEVSRALQVYKSLGSMEDTVNVFVDSLVQDTLNSFHIQQVMKGSIASFWEETERFLSELVSGTHKTALIDDVTGSLSDKCPPAHPPISTSVRDLMDLRGGETDIESIEDDVWGGDGSGVCDRGERSVGREVGVCVKFFNECLSGYMNTFRMLCVDVPSIRAALVHSEYPRLHGLLHSALNNLRECNRIAVNNTSFLNDLLRDIIDEYIDASSRRVRDPVYLMFPRAPSPPPQPPLLPQTAKLSTAEWRVSGGVSSGGEKVGGVGGERVVLPTGADLRAFVGIMKKEISACEECPDVLQRISESISDSINLLTTLITSLLDSSALHIALVAADNNRLIEVFGGCTVGHERNMRLYEMSCAVHTALSDMIDERPKAVKDILSNSLRLLHTFAVT
eukprot:GHVQ01035122.1.p1 GENE.GHVQ01035122.1~~GHVQ01035122.1.p1  ORF type:complete len:605 (-),score=112.74 GHVQ01035122.1:311-2125(-)